MPLSEQEELEMLRLQKEKAQAQALPSPKGMLDTVKSYLPNSKTFFEVKPVEGEHWYDRLLNLKDNPMGSAVKTGIQDMQPKTEGMEQLPGFGSSESAFRPGNFGPEGPLQEIGQGVNRRAILAQDDEGYANLIKSQLGPRFKGIRKDKNGYPIVAYQADDGTVKEEYVNKPGFDPQDFQRGVTQSLPYMAGGLGTGMLTSGLGKLAGSAAQGLAAGSTSLGLDIAGASQGTGVGPLQTAEHAASAAGGALLGNAAEGMVRQAVRKFRTAGLFTGGKLTPKGRELAIGQGLNPDEMEADVAKNFAADYVKSARPDWAARKAGAAQEGVPVTTGEITQDPAALLREREAYSGRLGTDAATRMREFYNRQREAGIGSLERQSLDITGQPREGPHATGDALTSSLTSRRGQEAEDIAGLMRNPPASRSGKAGRMKKIEGRTEEFLQKWGPGDKNNPRGGAWLNRATSDDYYGRQAFVDDLLGAGKRPNAESRARIAKFKEAATPEELAKLKAGLFNKITSIAEETTPGDQPAYNYVTKMTRQARDYIHENEVVKDLFEPDEIAKIEHYLTRMEGATRKDLPGKAKSPDLTEMDRISREGVLRYLLRRQGTSETFRGHRFKGAMYHALSRTSLATPGYNVQKGATNKVLKGALEGQVPSRRQIRGIGAALGASQSDQRREH